jgi:hypothetical protein
MIHSRAMTFNRKMMGPRYVELFRSNIIELTNALAMGAAAIRGTVSNHTGGGGGRGMNNMMGGGGMAGMMGSGGGGMMGGGGIAGGMMGSGMAGRMTHTAGADATCVKMAVYPFISFHPSSSNLIM